jgi:hypothetical protein
VVICLFVVGAVAKLLEAESLNSLFPIFMVLMVETEKNSRMV